MYKACYGCVGGVVVRVQMQRFHVSFQVQLPDAFQSLLRDIRVFLWRRGSSWLSPMVACNGKDTLTCVAGATCLVFAVGRRANDNNQPCDVVLGCVTMTVPNQTGTVSITTIDDYHRHLQVAMQAVFSKPPSKAEKTILPDYMLLLQRKTAALSSPPPKPSVPDNRWANAVPIMGRFDSMIRDWTSAPGNAQVRLPVIQWLQRVCFEAPGAQTSPLYYALVATWYMRWQQLDAVWHTKYGKYPELLAWLCGHHTWTYAYCSDSYLDLEHGQLAVGDNWCNSRWVPSAYRGPDCEDNTADIATTFYALQNINTDDPLISNPIYSRYNEQYGFMLRCLHDLANQYKLLVADTVLYLGNGDVQLHMYVKLVPVRQFARLVAGQAPDPDDDWPIMTVDSTRRSWTPDTPIGNDLRLALRDLYMHLRRTTCCCRKSYCAECQRTAAAECFTWGTPTHLWQKYCRDDDGACGEYHTDLRYYDPQTGQVYMPVLTHPKAYKAREDSMHVDLEKRATRPIFGIPALCLDGRDYLDQKMAISMTSPDAYNVIPVPGERHYMSVPVQLVNITSLVAASQPQQQQLPSVTSGKSDVETEEKQQKVEVTVDPALLVPPPRPLQTLFSAHYYDKVQDYEQDGMPLCNCVPVFIRLCDVPQEHRPRADTDKEWRRCLTTTAMRLKVMCKETITVVRAERMRVQEPEQYSLVFYVHTAQPNLYRAYDRREKHIPNA